MSENTLNSEFEQYLQDLISALPASTVRDAMEYSLMAAGKRVRPRLLFAVLEDYGIDPRNGFPMAAAIEMIHTYSLIHDDLPAMDDDDLRRGKPSCHVAFNEAAAILAGDGLLTLAFETAAKTKTDQNTLARLIVMLAQMAGAQGMVYGQILDLESSPDQSGLDAIYRIEKYKTGCLLQAPLLAGCLLAGKDEDLSAWKTIGELTGIQFQIQDDILDATKSAEELGKSNSDERNKKPTILTNLNLQQASEKVSELDEQIRTVCLELDRPLEHVESMLDMLRFRAH